MKQNNRKNTWKAIVAVMLVMATLFSISTMVSAGFVEEIFEEVCDMMTTSSSHEHTNDCYVTIDILCEYKDDKTCSLGKQFCKGNVHRTGQTKSVLDCEFGRKDCYS